MKLKRLKAVKKEGLGVNILSRSKLRYEEGVDIPDGAVHEFARAGSGLAGFQGRLVAVQDDADFLVVIDSQNFEVRPYAIPIGLGSARLYDDRDETARPDSKSDLEACFCFALNQTPCVISLGSGVMDVRKRIIVTTFPEGEPHFRSFNSEQFHRTLDDLLQPHGAGLNIEGAVCGSGNEVFIFSRGDKGEEPQDAIFVLNKQEFEQYLLRPEADNVPQPTALYLCDLGDLDGRPLTFSDAELVGDKILFSLSSESDDGAGESFLGIWQDEQLTIATGAGLPLEAKIEGVALLGDRLYLINDEDDFQKPASLFEIELIGDWSLYQRSIASEANGACEFSLAGM